MPEKGNFANGHGNRGGNEGNVYGAGTKPKMVRLKYLDGADVGADYSKKVAQGLKCIMVPPVPGMAKTRPTYRYPTHDERMDAIKECNRQGLPTKVELTGADDGPVHVSGLTDEERADRALAILERARARRDGSPPGPG